MKKLRIGLNIVALSGLLIFPCSVSAESTSAGVMISEIQTGSVASANEEFVELYNNSSEAVDINDWKLEYHPSSRTDFTNPSQTIVLSSSIKLYPGKHYLIAHTGFYATDADQMFGGAVADSGGYWRLVSPLSGTSQYLERDVVAWGNAVQSVLNPVHSPGSAASLTRKTLVSGGLQDTDSNSADFDYTAAPSPQSDNEAPVDVEPDPVPEIPPVPDPVSDPDPGLEPAPDPVPVDEPIPDPVTNPPFAEIQIVELYPNPAAPATDDANEFVELYNSNNQEVILDDYELVTGNTGSYHFSLKGIVIGPNSYLALYSKDTNLVLSNTSSKAQLLKEGTVVSEAASYADADEGEAWALIDGSWQWTTTPTPSASNRLTLTLVPIKTSATTTVKKTSTKATAAPKPKATSTKQTTAKTVSAKTAAKSKTAVKSASNQADAPLEPAPLHPGVLVGVSLLALLYALYEYRAEFQNYFRKLRRYRRVRS